MAPEISRRVGAILDAVEREAAHLREEAQAEAGRYTENARRHADGLVAERQRRISELSDELVAKSEAVVARLDDAAPVRQGFENLVRALGEAAERLSHESEVTQEGFLPPPFHEATMRPPPQPPGPFQQPQQPPPPFEYAPQPAPSEPYAGAPQQPPQQAGNPPAPAPRKAASGERDDAWMVAIRLAGVGSTRAEVRDHLSRVIGIVYAEPALDEIFGPGTGEDARLPGTGGRP